MNSEFKAAFLEELEEQLLLMDNDILKLEQEGESETVVQSLFRIAHTIKGSSAVMGYEEIMRLTHAMENLLERVRNKTLPVTLELIEVLFRTMDGLKHARDQIVLGVPSPVDLPSLIRELNDYSAAPVAAVRSARSQESLPDMRLKVNEAREQGFQVYWIHVQISPDCLIKGARVYLISSRLSEWGEVLLSNPDVEEIDELSSGILEVVYLYSGIQGKSELEASLRDLTDVVRVKVDTYGEQESEEEEQASSPSEQPAPPPASAADKNKNQSVRVNVERLEQLMNLVGELVIDQTRIAQVKRMQKRHLTAESVDELEQVSDHLSRIIGDLQECVMKARMFPIDQLFSRFPRMVRDLARNLGKEVKLVMDGKDTDLDRTLIEEITDPLVHLVRNSLDHGIETPEKRERAGKERKGTLRLRAAHEDNQVIIYVEDDGAGIDPAKMKKAALEKKIITAEEAEQLTEQEAIRLIFRPGFSTAARISDISGRGVGMDIVKSHIEKLNGLIDIETELGKGTRFKIKLPLTLAIIVGLLVKLGKETFIIPMSNIAEIVRVAPEDIQRIKGQPVILLRNQVIPVAWIHERFQIARAEDSKRQIPLVIVGSAEKRLALAVDELLGNQEVVIKSLGSYIGRVPGIAGGTILGNGKVAFILDISGVIQMAGTQEPVL
ncbi:chemotaxis protein CheA [Gorillibacterium timonense]|uniref:chemotaxis protein CheA n=1 Tax=Gorillibacterium timonense TaxID=1689269 RepID=UPI00071C5F7E|nr:chemotaxis protein CheA [Gorillibacterium timonense]